MKEKSNINQEDKKMSKKVQNLLNNTLLFLIGSIGSKIIQFVLVPLYTYTLTTEQYGITEIIITAISILTPIFSMSIADGFLRFGLNKKYDKEEVTSIALKILLFGTVCSVLCIPLFKLSSSISEYLCFFLLILNLRMYRDIFAIRLKIYDKNKLYAIDSIIYTFVLCISNFILLVCFKLEINGYFISHVIANIFSILFICIISKPSIKTILKKTNRELLRKIIIYSLPMIINGIAWWITNASDKFMLAWMMTQSDVGIYSISAKLPTLVTTFTGIFIQAWIISSVIEFDNEKEKKFYSVTFKKYYGLIFLASSSLILIIKLFMKFYVSEEYYIAWKYVPFLVAGAAATGIGEYMVGIYSASMKNINVTLTTLVGGIINIILNYILIQRIGIMGAAISTYISWNVIEIIRIIDIRKIFNFSIDYKNLFLYKAILLIQVVSVTFLDNILGQLISLILFIIFFIMERKLIVLIFDMILNKITKRKKYILLNEKEGTK